MKLNLILAMLFVTITSVNAAEETGTQNDISSMAAPISANVNNPIAYDRWYFLGCVDSEHARSDAAHHSGFHHHYVRHHDSRCHHDHHEDGCYGRN